MSMFGFPLLLIPLAIYNIIVFLMPGTSLTAPMFTAPLMSGVVWSVTLSDLLLGTGILMLMFEVMKGARPGGKYLTDHLLAFLVLGGAAAEFVTLPPFGTSTFALLTALALVDFLSGIALRGRRVRPVTTATIAREAPVAAQKEVVAEPVKAEPRAEPVVAKAEPAPQPTPSAAPVAESILSDAPAPVTPATPAPQLGPAQQQQPAAPASTASPAPIAMPAPAPTVMLPGLQPANHNEPPAR